MRTIRLTGDYDKREAQARSAGCACVWHQHMNSSGPTARYALVEVAYPTTLRELATAHAAANEYAQLLGGGLGYGSGVKVLKDGERGESIVDGNAEAFISEPLFVSNPTQAAWIAKPENQRAIAECNVRALRANYPDDALIGLSIGHVGKTSNPADRGADVVGTGLTEAAVCAGVIAHMETLLAGQEENNVKVLRGSPGRVWRLSRGTEHLWRTDEVGINAALKEGFTLEAGYAFDLLGTIPVHSLRSPNGDTLLTIDGAEIATLTANGWVDEGSIGGAGTTGAPVYRLAHGKHLHTADKSERDALLAAQWTDEGIGFYCGEPAGSDANERIAALEAKLDKVAVVARDLLAAVA